MKNAYGYTRSTAIAVSADERGSRDRTQQAKSTGQHPEQPAADPQVTECGTEPTQQHREHREERDRRLPAGRIEVAGIRDTQIPGAIPLTPAGQPRGHHTGPDGTGTRRPGEVRDDDRQGGSDADEDRENSRQQAATVRPPGDRIQNSARIVAFRRSAHRTSVPSTASGPPTEASP
jgi:hypothetical protein